MKKTNLTLLFYTLLLTGISLCSFAQVQINGKKIMVNGQQYMIRGVCYSPIKKGNDYSNYPEYGWPSYSIIESDLALMKAAGMNTIRTYTMLSDPAALAKVTAAGMKVINGIPYSDTRSAVEAQYRYGILEGTYKAMVTQLKDNPAILMWCLGNETNYATSGVPKATWLAKLEEAAAWIKANDPNHPVCTAWGEIPTAADVAACPSVDVWGVNVYRNATAGAAIGEWINLGINKPFFFSEVGVDAYNHNKAGGAGVDEAAQSTGIAQMWNDVKWSITNNGACSGLTVFEFCDEWWKSGATLTQEPHGNAPGSFYPDGNTDEEYYGIVDINRKPRAAYNKLKELWSPYNVVATPCTYTLEDVECARHLNYWNFGGGFNVEENPSKVGNTSNYCIKYDRAKKDLYPAIVAKTPVLNNIAQIVGREKLIQLDVYSALPGKDVLIVLQNHAKIDSKAWPKGINSEYKATTSKTNQWETLSFVLNQQLDQTVLTTEIDEIAILFEPGVFDSSATKHTYYYDNLKAVGPVSTIDVGVQALVAPTKATDCFSSPQSLTFSIFNYGAQAVNLVTNPVTVKVNISGAGTLQYSSVVTTGTIAAGGSTNVTVTTTADFSTLGTYNINAYTEAMGDATCTNNALSQMNIASELCTGVDEQDLNINTLALSPNPFKNSTVIKYSTSDNSAVLLEVFDLLGNKVSTIANSNSEKGIHLINWDASNLTSGIYFVKMSNNSEVKTLKVLIAR